MTDMHKWEVHVQEDYWTIVYTEEEDSALAKQLAKEEELPNYEQQKILKVNYLGEEDPD